MKKFIFILLIALYSCGDCAPGFVSRDKIEQLRVGMTSEQFFSIVGKQDWDEVENGVYDYGMNYWSESGVKHTCWVSISNGKIIEIVSV